MKGQRRPSDPWKKKVGVEFSGLENRHDFWVALVIGAAFIITAMVIAFVAFG